MSNIDRRDGSNGQEFSRSVCSEFMVRPQLSTENQVANGVAEAKPSSPLEVEEQLETPLTGNKSIGKPFSNSHTATGIHKGPGRYAPLRGLKHHGSATFERTLVFKGISG